MQHSHKSWNKWLNYTVTWCICTINSRIWVLSHGKESSRRYYCLVLNLFVHHHNTVRWQYHTLMVSSVPVHFIELTVTDMTGILVCTMIQTEYQFRAVYYSRGNLMNHSAWHSINIFVLLMQVDAVLNSRRFHPLCQNQSAVFTPINICRSEKWIKSYFDVDDVVWGS